MRPPAPTTEPPGGRVLIVDDSAVARAVFARVVDASDRLHVAGSVPTAAAALAFLEGARVDLIVLDINMPGTDGLTALPGLLAAGALGMTDLFFLGLLAESARAHGLRYRLTAGLMVASLGATFALAAGFDRALPALPLMSLAFLGANADLLLARLRR